MVSCCAVAVKTPLGSCCFCISWLVSSRILVRNADCADSFAISFSLEASEPVRNDARNMIKNVIEYPLSYACKVNRGSVKIKLKISTVEIEAARPHRRLVVITEMISTVKIYTVVILTSVKPS